MSSLNVKLSNKWLERTMSIDANGVLKTSSIINKANNKELLLPGGEEFLFVAYYGELMRILRCEQFQYVSHDINQLADGSQAIFYLELKPQLASGASPFAVGGGANEIEDNVWCEWDNDLGNIKVEVIFRIYEDHPVIRKKLRIINGDKVEIRLQDLAWEDVKLQKGLNRHVQYHYFTRQALQVTDSMDDCVMAVTWDGEDHGLLVATEAPGAMKRMELFKNEDKVRLLYNNSEETIFEWTLGRNETFETDAGFLVTFCGNWQDAVDGVYHQFVADKLAICRVDTVPGFTMNTWETFYNEINEQIVLENIEIAAELGMDAYQLDCGWYEAHGNYVPHSLKFPNGLEPIKAACDKHNMRLGLWMSVPVVAVNSPVALSHPEWFLSDENGDKGFMVAWKDTGIMCLQSDYKYWILEQMDAVIKKYGVELLKLDLAAVRDPYNPGKSIGCHSRNHHHPTQKSSNLGIYRSMFWIMDELRARNPNCLIDLTFELYGVLHGTDLAHVQHAHQNWIANQDTPYLDPFRRLLHTRSRIVPSYTLNFGSCHLTEAAAEQYGFWSALLSHGLYYGDLRKLSVAQKKHYQKWIAWVKAYRSELDFYAYSKVSNIFDAPDTPDHVDRRFNRYSFYEAGRVASQAARWDGTAKLNNEGEGLILIFRPSTCSIEESFIPFPWMRKNRSYQIVDVLAEKIMGSYMGDELCTGITLKMPLAQSVLVLQCKISE
ncbi:alpha-galactosidase [Paenibacillus psychroresistens]|uniref:Alpha-galactosidase n=1 Tax=Paenibacillus psychroresistens TaxID=1778678 RepID=A0A6B8RWC1_9BACL|nr:alpha-galactosidase [Paenibacillus psychroresistens]QGQ99408.1 alpha-galactosidase [Paenibacillus psychroresistens]